MATPLTICVVVLGKHVPGLRFLATLLTDAPALSPASQYYQRLLAHDPGEAADLIERHVAGGSVESVYDALLVPALNYARRDRLEKRLSDEDEARVVAASRELIEDVDVHGSLQAAARGKRPDAEPVSEPRSASDRTTVLAFPAASDSDELALRMLQQLLQGSEIVLDIAPSRMLASELVSLIAKNQCNVVCIADLPPSTASRTRYLVKKLRAAMPTLKIVVGRWAPEDLNDESPRVILDAGATCVGASLVETRGQLLELARLAPGVTLRA